MIFVKLFTKDRMKFAPALQNTAKGFINEYFNLDENELRTTLAMEVL